MDSPNYADHATVLVSRHGNNYPYPLSCAEPSFASVCSCQHSRLHKHSSSFDFSFEPDAWSFNLIQELNKIFKTCSFYICTSVKMFLLFKIAFNTPKHGIHRRNDKVFNILDGKEWYLK